MKDLTREQIEYAVSRFIRLMEVRALKQQWIASMSGVNQSTISKIENGWKEQGAEKYLPSEDILTKLFKALGHKLTDILNESDSVGNEILGYLATPLTGLSPIQDLGLRNVVVQIREIASGPQFASPAFEIYWPGEHTHPMQHSEIPAIQVYITDRTRAATHDFIIMLCASPSYGVGQENEIATQAGVPLIRLIPSRLSRMMLGSFAKATDIDFSGSLETGIVFDSEALRRALAEVKIAYIRRCAFYQGLNGEGFGDRLRALVQDRCGSTDQFAEDLGISHSYLHSLMGESIAVSNPSIRLLKRMAHRLNERVSYLIGDSDEGDSIWIDSHAAWRSWIDENRELTAAAVLAVRDEWRHEYNLDRRAQSASSSTSHRREISGRMEAKDWDIRYQKFLKSDKKAKANAQSPSLF